MKYSILKLLSSKNIIYLEDSYDSLNEEFQEEFEKFVFALRASKKEGSEITEETLTQKSDDLVELFKERHNLNEPVPETENEEAPENNENKKEVSPETEKIKPKVLKEEVPEVEKEKPEIKEENKEKGESKTKVSNSKRYLSISDLEALGIKEDVYLQKDGDAADFEHENIKYTARKALGARIYYQWYKA